MLDSESLQVGTSARIVKGTKTVKYGLVMTSTDPVAMEAATSRIAGINPNSVRHIVLASKEKIGNINLSTKGDARARNCQ